MRFNLTSEKNEEQPGSESDDEGNSRPSFLSVKKTAGSLDKELAASGFTRKEQVEMEKVGQMFSANLLFFFFGDFANLLFMHTFIDCFLAKLSDTFFFWANFLTVH